MKKPTHSRDSLPESASLVADNVARLAALFPEAVVEGKVDFEVLRELLGDAVDDRPEKYGLHWHGKRGARQLAMAPAAGTLRTCPDESLDWDTTSNVVIDGDNLDVLKLLQTSYAGKVKLIYIDPPYNTGGAFVYRDNFRGSPRRYLQQTGQLDDRGRLRRSAPAESAGRFHTDWLNLMYPRLILARRLLRDDGLMCISIDDREFPQLRLVANEVFGEESFVAACVWQKRYSRENRGIIGDVHEYLLFYAMNVEALARVRNLLPLDEASKAVYRNPNDDPRGPWRTIPMTAQGSRPNQMYTIVTPTGVAHSPPKGRCWSTVEAEYRKHVEAGRVWFGADGNGQPNLIRYLSEVDGLVPWTWWPHEEVGHTDEAKKEIHRLLGKEHAFDTPKPVRLMKRVLEIGTRPDQGDLVLDFFSGSNTLAQAVIEKNLVDSGNRRFIMVQAPEPTRSTAFPTIAEIGKERIRRASRALALGHQPHDPAADLGFRVFKLDANRADDPRGELEVLFALALESGLDLGMRIAMRTIAGKSVLTTGCGRLAVCLAPTIGRDDAEPLLQGIAAWLRERNPAIAARVAFRRGAFTEEAARQRSSNLFKDVFFV